MGITIKELSEISGYSPATISRVIANKGNASGINDCGAAVVLMTEEEAKKRGLKPIVKVAAAEAGEDIFGFCLDTGHANLLGKNLYQYIHTLGKRLTVLHINDNMGMDDNHMIPYTQLDRQGNKTAINWENLIKGLKEIGYEGTLSFETFRGLGILPRECWKEGLQLISSIGRYFKMRLE